MIESIVIGAIGGAVAVAALAVVANRSRVFVIRIRNGFPAVIKGKVSQAFVGELAGLLKEKGIRGGAVYGVRRRGTVALEFSRGIPPSDRQSLRNVWAMHGR
jgi:hypothetical protein